MATPYMIPTSAKEVKTLGWDYIDVILFTGDAFVDHPSFGTALLSRLLEANGYRVCICAQPDRNEASALTSYGVPRLGVLISGGVIDSMVNHYSVSKRPRKKDSYSNNGEGGHRPDRAVIVYSQKIREAYPDTTILIGGSVYAKSDYVVLALNFNGGTSYVNFPVYNTTTGAFPIKAFLFVQYLIF